MMNESEFSNAEVRQAVLDTLKRIEEGQSETREMLHQTNVTTAVLTERVENLTARLDANLKSDEALHKRVSAAERKHDSLRTKLAAYASAVGFVVAFIGGFAKDAVASWLSQGGN
jgi:predicted  nucleic acid-binding Zn-ribbon protein